MKKIILALCLVLCFIVGSAYSITTTIINKKSSSHSFVVNENPTQQHQFDTNKWMEEHKPEKDVMDYMIPIGSFIVKRGDKECKFASYDLAEIIQHRIENDMLDREKLAILYHQSKKFDFSNFKELLKCLATRQGGIKDVQHQLEIDTAIEKLCLDGVEYET